MQRWERLFKFKGVREWYDNDSRGSFQTSDSNMKHLDYFSAGWIGKGVPPGEKTNPDELRTNPRKGYDQLLRHIHLMESAGKAENYVKGRAAAVMSWINYNHPGMQFPAIKFASNPAAKRKVPVMLPEQITKVRETTDSLTRMAMDYVGYQGMRPEVLGCEILSKGKRVREGLRLKDFPELRLYPKISFTVEIPRVVVREEISKNGKEYFTWLVEPTKADSLFEWNKRRDEGEELGPESAAVKNPASGGFFLQHSLSKRVRLFGIRPAGCKFAFVHFRTFMSQMLQGAEEEPSVAFPHEDSLFYTGHTGDILRIYVQRHKLPEILETRMKGSWQRASRFFFESNPLGQKLCPNQKCGVLNEFSAKFCKECGARLEQIGEIRAPPSVSQS